MACCDCESNFIKTEYEYDASRIWDGKDAIGCSFRGTVLYSNTFDGKYNPAAHGLGFVFKSHTEIVMGSCPCSQIKFDYSKPEFQRKKYAAISQKIVYVKGESLNSECKCQYWNPATINGTRDKVLGPNVLYGPEKAGTFVGRGKVIGIPDSVSPSHDGLMLNGGELHGEGTFSWNKQLDFTYYKQKMKVSHECCEGEEGVIDGKYAEEKDLRSETVKQYQEWKGN